MFEVVNGGTPTAEDAHWDGDIPWATPVDLARVDGGTISDTDRTLTPAGLRTGSRSVRPGSLIVSTRAPIGYVAQTASQMAFNQGCRGLQPRENIDIRYYRYQLSSMRAQLEMLGQGSTFVELSTESLSAARLYSPPIEEQRAIAGFLDTETARIDALITKKGGMIEAFNERRHSLLAATLMEATDPVAVLMGGSESTVELKRVLQRTIAGGTPDTANESFWSADEADLPWIAIGDMIDRGATASTSKSVTKEGMAAARLHVGPPGTVLFAMYASMGKLTVTRVSAAWNQAIIGLQPDPRQLDSEYLAYWLEALRPHLGILARSNTQDNLNAEQIEKLMIPLVSLEQQQALAAYIKTQFGQHERVTDRLRRQIDLLQEHRQALITSAVAGKLDLPGVAA